MTDKVVSIVSGGLDSVTMLYHLRALGYENVHALGFNYGQRHKKELKFAAQASEKLDIPFSVIDLWEAGLGPLLATGSSLTTEDVAVPEGHYAEESMKATVVPNRNMVMLSIAGSVAVAEGADWVATGVHSGDHFIYPDCRPGFIEKTSEAMLLGNLDFTEWDARTGPILTPFLDKSKADIAEIAFQLGVPVHLTWSCYQGQTYHCGRCGTCVERLEAIDQAQKKIVKEYDFTYTPSWLVDHTTYLDKNYWKQAVANAH